MKLPPSIPCSLALHREPTLPPRGHWSYLPARKRLCRASNYLQALFPDKAIPFHLAERLSKHPLPPAQALDALGAGYLSRAPLQTRLTCAQPLLSLLNTLIP